MEIGEVQRLIKQKIFFNSNCIIFDIKRMRINLKEKSKDQETIRLVSSISQISILEKKVSEKEARTYTWILYNLYCIHLETQLIAIYSHIASYKQVLESLIPIIIKILFLTITILQNHGQLTFFISPLASKAWEGKKFFNLFFEDTGSFWVLFNITLQGFRS